MNKMSKQFQIYVKPCSSTLAIDVTNSTTVKYIKSYIEDKEGIPIKYQNLHYGYKKLDDIKTLEYYYIDNEATIKFSFNGKGGAKNKKKSHKKKKPHVNKTRELEFKTDMQEYGRVTKILGNNRVTIMCCDGKPRLGIIRGKMRKRVWIREGDYVLVSLRGFQDSKCDITFKYTDQEVRNLIIYGEIPDLKINCESIETTTECSFKFESEV